MKNGKVEAKTTRFGSDDLKTSHTKITLEGKGNDYPLSLDLEWGVNLYEAKTENTLLLDAHEVSLYDIEVKFDNYNEYSNAKLKIVYGNKAFELGH